MSGYRDMVLKELREAWRTWRFAAVCLLFLGLGVSAPILTKILPDLIRAFGPTGFEVDISQPGIADVIDQLLQNTIQLGTLAVILVTMGAVASERERGTASFVLAKPVSRGAFLAAKLAAIGLLFAIAIGLAVGGAWLYTLLLFHRPPISTWIEMAGVIWLSAMVYASITFLGSVLARSSLGAAGIGFLGLVVLTLLSVIPNIQSWIPAGLSAVAESIALREPSPDVDPALTIGISVVVAVVAVAVAWWRFRSIDL